MKLFLSLLLPQLSGIIGSFFTIQAIPDWYMKLNKPWFSPPNWVFGPVWLVLYTFMGIALYLNWIKKSQQSKVNVRLFFIHLFFNFIWTPVFFGMKNLELALVIIIILWCLIIKLIIDFNKMNKISSILLIPYLLWVTFATVLNFSLMLLN